MIIQIATAKQYPRSISTFVKSATEMATLDAETAAGCFYQLKRYDASSGRMKTIEGPSIRMAEIIQNAWGNIRTASRVVGETDEFVLAQGICMDLETNSARSVEIRRQIVTKEGKKYKHDMRVVTGNAAAAIAVRNAIFGVVPRALIMNIYNEAKKVALGEGATLIARREKCLATFLELDKRLTEPVVLQYAECEAREDINLKTLLDLIGAYNAIKDGEATVEELFFPKPAEAHGDRGKALADKSRANREAQDKAKTDTKAKSEKKDDDKGKDDKLIK